MVRGWIDRLTLSQRDQGGLAGRVVRKDSNTDETAHAGDLDDMTLVPLDHIRGESSTSEPVSSARRPLQETWTYQ